MMAIPADPKPRSVIQADGSTLVVRLCGDEFYHFFATIDGQVVVEDGKNGWFYADCNEDGVIRPSSVLAHNADLRDARETDFLNQRESNGKSAAIRQYISRAWTQKYTLNNEKRINRAARRVLDGPGHYIGKKRGLVILVEFANLSMESPTSQQDYDDRFNQKNYSKDGHVGSVSDYFLDQSYGAFELTFDVIGPVKLSRNYGYYGTDGTGTQGHDQHADEMIREACSLADPYVNFEDYDWDHDGEADQVYIIYAGYGQATGGADNTVWPHESHLECSKDGTIELDNTVINTYACSNELYGDNRELYMGIGTACHEFSHCLGLPDTYDTDYSGAYGMGYWGVMNSGSYNGPQGRAEVPCGYTAFERWYVGWLEMNDITTSRWVSQLPDLEQSPVAFRMRSENTPDEYFIFENRQGTKWFSYVSQISAPHGMLVTHIDYDARAWRDNVVNPSPTLQRMTIIPADGEYQNTFKGLNGDLFPGTSEVTLLDNKSHYATGAKLNHANSDGSFTMNATISQIEESEDDGSISFCAVLNRDLETPTALSAVWEGDHGLRLRWNRAVGALSYEVQLLKVVSHDPLLTERKDFHDITTCYCDIDLNDYKDIFFRVRSCRGNLYSDWSAVTEVENVRESLKQVVSDDGIDTYYNINGRPIQHNSYHQDRGIVISAATQKKIVYLR